MKKFIAIILTALILSALVIPVFSEDESAVDTETVAAASESSGDAETGEAATEDTAEPEEKSTEDTAASDEEVTTTGEEGETDDEDADDEESYSLPAEGTVISVKGAPDYVVKSAEFYENYAPSDVFDDDGHFKDVRALDYVVLKNYEKLVIPQSEIDARIDERIEPILQSYAAPEQLTEGIVKDGDTISIDYTGYVDGETFSGGSATDSVVTIGTTNFIDGFLEQIPGHNVGDTFDIDVTFPDDYSNADLAGKPATFTVTINYLEGEDVVPELTDEFVAEYITPQMAELVTAQDVRNFIEENYKIKNGLIIEHLIAENEVTEIPDAVYSFPVDYTIQSLSGVAASYGYDLASYLALSGQTLEAVVETYAESNVQNAKLMLIIQAIDEARDDIAVTEEDMAAFALENMGTEDYSSYAEQYGIGIYKNTVLEDVVMKYITEHTSYGGVGMKTIIIAACVAGGAILVIALILIFKNKKKNEDEQEELPDGDAENAETDEDGEDGDGMIDLNELLGEENDEDDEEDEDDEDEDEDDEDEDEDDEDEDEIEESSEDAVEVVDETVEETAEVAVEEVEEAVEEKAEDAAEAVAEDADATVGIFEDAAEEAVSEIEEKTEE